MNKELQDDYNEWLLKYGYREVPVDQARIDKVYYMINVLHTYTPNDLLNRTEFPMQITYQLKTPEELQND